MSAQSQPAVAPGRGAAPQSRPSLTIRRRIKASPAAVYAAWTEPEKMIGWWGTAGAETLHAEADPVVGGRFRVIFRAADGEVHNVSGTYQEVVPNRKLVFSWAWVTTPERESLVTVMLRPDGDGTVLTLTHERFFDRKARDDHRRGWGETLDNLAAFLAR